jgi:cell fate regulator YaaT (PSP1 superfamily)
MPERFENMTKRVIGVRFKKAGRMYYFDPGALEINEGDGVIVETARGMELRCLLAPRDVPRSRLSPL